MAATHYDDDFETDDAPHLAATTVPAAAASAATINPAAAGVPPIFGVVPTGQPAPAAAGVVPPSATATSVADSVPVSAIGAASVSAVSPAPVSEQQLRAEPAAPAPAVPVSATTATTTESSTFALPATRAAPTAAAADASAAAPAAAAPARRSASSGSKFDPQARFAAPKPRGARKTPLNFVCPKCSSVLFGGARLQVASVMLPECDECSKLGYAEVFYSPPRWRPEETRGMILKKKNMELLKVTLQEKDQRSLDHAKAQLQAIDQYVSRSRNDKCTRVHAIGKQQQQQEEAAAAADGAAAAKEDATAATAKKPCANKQEQAAAKRKAAADAAVADRPPVFSDVPHFDSSSVSTTTVHGAALAAPSGDALRKVVEAEAGRLNVTPESLLAIPGFIDLKGRRLGVKRVSRPPAQAAARYELGFGFAATPLHMATMACRADLVAVLLDLGADPLASAGPSSINATNKALLAPNSIEMSKANGFDAITSLLENAVANSAAAKFDAFCKKKLAAAQERVRQRREKLEGAAAAGQ
jgi:hypothetical protein